ncbi:hypothetical protein PCANB_001251 [Pneumocystis canis]|nr:hypothetical protein PCANB_001251 [Pneumocystis canis]
MKKADGKRCTKQIFLKRSHSYNSILEPVSIVKTSIFSPPLYGHPPGPLASLSFTSLFRTSPLQLSTTPESSDNESFNRTQNINFVKRYPLTAKVPTYEYYGFVLYLGSSIVFVLTPKLNQMECITDLYAKVSSSVNIKPTSDAVIDLPIGEVSFLLYGDSGCIVQRTIVCQNENDLCPIIALTNLLILQNSERDFLSSYFSLNNSRISSNLLLSIIADYAVSNIPEECLDDVFSYLLHLHKELNVNPCFKDSLQFDSQESKLFSALGVQLLHGWLPSIKQDGQDIYNVVIKAGTYKNALEKITVMKELLKNKKSESNFNDKNIFEGQLLNHFFSSYPHCLTPYGLTVLRTNLSPGKLSILFHNFRFSLLYSHYQTGDLYTLVTDCDYKDYENKVVWKSLETSLYFNAEFTLQNILPNDLSDIDNDFAFALNLQLIEDQQKENWIYHLSQSQKYKKRKTPKKYKQKNNNLNNVIIPSWKKRNSSNDSEELNRHLRKEKKCIIF